MSRCASFLTDELGKARQPVAGFDWVFSPVKSVSLLWGLGGHEVRATVEQKQETAWWRALAYGEQVAAFTRTGAGGVAQHPTHGYITTAVSMSELYNSAVEQGLVERFGVPFVEVSKGAGKRPVREIDGMPTEWIRGFSRRRSQVEAIYCELVRDYVRRYGHTPPRTVQPELAQQATLTNRPATERLRTLAEQIADWTRHALALLPGISIPEVIAGSHIARNPWPARCRRDRQPGGRPRVAGPRDLDGVPRPRRGAPPAARG